MTETATLRDRRRRQTASEIQAAALRLALRDGHEAITTEMIATEAGISLRTFFNYFPNKQSALVGRQPVIEQDLADWFRNADGTLIDDLCEVLRRHMHAIDLHRDTARMIDRLLARSPELMPAFHASLQRLSQQLSQLILTRTGPDHAPEAELMSEIFAHALANGFRAWASDTDMKIDDITSILATQIRRLQALLQR